MEIYYSKFCLQMYNFILLFIPTFSKIEKPDLMHFINLSITMPPLTRVFDVRKETVNPFTSENNLIMSSAIRL